MNEVAICSLCLQRQELGQKARVAKRQNSVSIKEVILNKQSSGGLREDAWGTEASVPGLNVLVPRLDDLSWMW